MQYTINQTNKKTTHSVRKIIFLTILLVTILGIGGAFAYSQIQSKNTTEVEKRSTKSDQSVGQVNTYEAKSEGQKIDVPSNVDPDSIKNYVLVTENEEFKIRKLNNEYTVTLYAMINSPSQADIYRDQLKQFKDNALKYLQDNGVNTDKVNITYEPAEAKDL